ncbi:MAG: hypothetical protein IMW90_11805 [Thermogemmatispora sp.]|jgi:hypothetical protein|uniref:hypothetical protein n=1 Tax=Thermogemmatispora sp. TaxID=1968838 RepID=UPI0019F7DBA4|nr:hypothetical protein [Thermogemmatispora sp.]MBE3566401.1 hypothetical protein [Thermogemmatispora sp.]
MIRLFYWLDRFLSKREKPLLQLLVGVLLIPVGAVVAYAACSGEYIYPYWVILGGGLAFFGLVLLLKGLILLLNRKRSSAAAAASSAAREPVAGQDAQASQAGQAFSTALSPSARSGGPRQMPAGSAATVVPAVMARAGQSPVAPPPQLSWWGGTPWPAEPMDYPGHQPPSPPQRR